MQNNIKRKIFEKAKNTYLISGIDTGIIKIKKFLIS